MIRGVVRTLIVSGNRRWNIDALGFTEEDAHINSFLMKLSLSGGKGLLRLERIPD